MSDQLPKKTQKSLDEFVLYHLFIAGITGGKRTLNQEIEQLENQRLEAILKALVDYLRIKLR